MFEQNSIFKVNVHNFEYVNDPIFWRFNYVENQTDNLYSYKNTTYKKWVLTDIEEYNFILEVNNEILPIRLDKDLNKGKAYIGRGIYIIEEFNFEHEKMKFVYKAIMRKMLTKSHYKGARKFLLDTIDKITANELIFPFKFILTIFVPEEYVANEINDLGEFIIYKDVKQDYFRDIDEDKIKGNTINLEITISDNTEKDELLIIDNKRFNIKSKKTFSKNNYIIAFKDPVTGRQYDRYHITNPMFNFNIRKISRKLLKTKQTLLTLSEGLDIVEKTLLELNTKVIEQEIKARRDVIEITINSLKSMFAENKVMQSALNVAKEELIVEKEELNKNKEIIKTAGEAMKTFS